MPQNDSPTPRRLQGDFAPNPPAPFVELGVTTALCCVQPQLRPLGGERVGIAPQDEGPPARLGNVIVPADAAGQAGAGRRPGAVHVHLQQAALVVADEQAL